MNSILKIKNIPSFQYFLLNNYTNMELLLKIVKKENIEKLFQPLSYEYIPFWVFIIRILSSTNCLAFENNKNPLEKTLTKIIRNKILLLMKSEKNSDLSWINLITDEIKLQPIFNKKIHMFYIFFNKVCSMENASKDISQYINSLLIEVFQSLFDISLNQQFNDFLDTDINSNKYPALDFVKDPRENIKKFINKNLSKIMSLELFESKNINYSKTLEEFIKLINEAQKTFKQKVNQLEIKLRDKQEKDLIKKFEEKNQRGIQDNEIADLMTVNESQVIYFDHNTVDDVITLLNDTEKISKIILDNIIKVKNNEIIDLNDFEKIFKNLINNLESFDSIYNVDEEYIDNDFKSYLAHFQKNVNSFKNNFNIFSKKYDLLPKIDTDKIIMNGFALPLCENTPLQFNLNNIDDRLNILAQPLIIKKHNKLFCNYKKIYFNTGPVSPELFNELCHLKIYSLVNEPLYVELNEEEEIQKNEIKNEIIEEDEFEIIKIKEDMEKNIKELYDTNSIKYMKLVKNNIEPESVINIEFSFPPPNISNEEIIYRLKRNLKVSINSSFIDIIIEIIFIVCPIQIDFSCEQYSLIFENEQFKLDKKILLKGETINFKINNCYKENHFILKPVIKSLSKNTYDEPEIVIKQSGDIKLTIANKGGNINDIDILNCLVEIYISEKIKIPILIDSLIVSTYFDFYVYDYETKNFIMNKMAIYIPTFEDKCTIEFHFLVSTFNVDNIIGIFKISDISDGIKVIDAPDKMKINSNENHFSVKLEFDLTDFIDNELAVFEFRINNIIKKIELLKKSQAIKDIDLKLIHKIENNKKLTNINNINNIKKDSVLVSPFTCWGKGKFLFRQSYINGKKDLELEIPNNAVLYYLSEEGYIEKEKENDYLIIIQIKDKWYSTVDFENFISQIRFQNILLSKLNNFFDDFKKYFPKECNKLYGNQFEVISKLFSEKSNELINDKEYVLNLIENHKNIYDLADKNYYYFNKENNIFNNSKTLQTLIDAIKDAENEYDLNIDINTKENSRINESLNNISNIWKDDEKSENESDEIEKDILINIKDSQIINKKIIDKRFIIQNGVPIKDLIKKDSFKLNKLKDYNFGNSETIKIEISEAKLIEKPEVITINSLIKFFDNCDLGTIVFPLYIYKAKQSKDKEDISNMNKYFSILGNAYLSLNKDTKNNIIAEYTNQFKKSFEYMMSKLKALGFNSDKFNISKILQFDDNEMIFHLPEKGNFKIPKSMFIKQEKKVRQNKNELEPQKNEIIEKKNEIIKPKKQIKKKIRPENKREDLENDNNNIDYVYDYDNKIENENGINNIFDSVKKVIVTEKKEIHFRFNFPILNMEMPKEIQKIYTDFSFENEAVNNKKKAINQRHIEKEIQSEIGITGKDFDVTNFDEKNEIKTIINHMKNSKKTQFNYKKEKNLIFLQDIQEFLDNKNEKENEIQLLQTLIELSIPITKKLIKTISYENTQKEIRFNNLEINLIFDCAKIINTFQKYIYFIIIIGLINAFSSLKINYLFSIVGDCQFKAVIKDFNEPHSKNIIKRIFECITIQRYRTNIASCAKIALDKFPILNENNKRIFYFFTNGIDDEYNLYDEWNKEIFNVDNAVFLFLFFLPIKSIESKEDYDFVCNELNQFSNKCNTKENLYTYIINEYKDIFDGKILNENLIKLFKLSLITNQKQNLDIKIYPAKFELSANNIKKEIDNFKKDFLDYDDINFGDEDIFAKKEIFDFIYTIPQIDSEEIKEINLKVGKIITLPLIDNISDFVKYNFKIPKEKINVQLLEIIFEPNLPTEMILTDVGTQIDIYEFIKLCINPTPNPKIYRQLGDGFVKNYGLTVVIDSSYSCLGGISREHTINTIRYLLSAISYIDLPSFNLIISTDSNPIVICSERGTLDALSNKSQLWVNLFHILNEDYRCINSNLVSAIRAAYNITNARKQEHTDYLFILTDGLFQKFETDKILKEIIYCCSKNLLVIGIGVGYYPYGIEKLFPYIVYSVQPNKIIEAIALSFSDSKINNSDLSLKDPDYKLLNENNIFKYYETFENYKPDSPLIQHLKQTKVF